MIALGDVRTHDDDEAPALAPRERPSERSPATSGVAKLIFSQMLTTNQPTQAGNCRVLAVFGRALSVPSVGESSLASPPDAPCRHDGLANFRLYGDPHVL